MRSTFFLIFCIAISTAAFTNADENIIPEDDFASYDVESVFEEEDVTQDELNQIEADCSGARNAHKKTVQKVKSTISIVANALKRQKKLCDAQEKETKKRKEIEDKAKKVVSGETFKFKPSPCKGGSGKFKKMMKQNARATVGLIPAGQNNVKVQLKSKHDLDVELWGEYGKIAVVAWRCAYMNKVRKTPTKCLDTAGKGVLQYAGAKITYSGWTGTDGKMGNEYIHIKGKLSTPVMVRAYGYVKGNAAVTYSWGADKALCKKKQQEAKAEKQAKHAAKVAAKKAMNEKGVKRVESLLAAATKTCSGAHTQTKKAKERLKYARKQVINFKATLDKCIDENRKEKKQKKEKKHKHELAAKAKAELQGKAKEKAKKKAEAKKKEVAEKKELKEKAAKTDAREKAAKKKEKAAKKVEKAKKAEKAKKEKAKKENATKKEKADKKAEKASKAKEKAGKLKERKHKAELRAKAEKRAKAVEKAQKAKKEKTTKRQEKKMKEANQKETRSKERASKRKEKARKTAEKQTKKANAQEKANKAATAAERKMKEIKSKKCAIRHWRTNKWYAGTNCCKGCDGRAPSPGSIPGSCIRRDKYAWAVSQCSCRATPRGTTDFKTNKYYFNVDCCKGCKAAQSSCVHRQKMFAWTSVCTCRMQC